MENTRTQLPKTALYNPVCHGKPFLIFLLFWGWGFFPLKKTPSAFSHTPCFIKDTPQIQMSRYQCFVNLWEHIQLSIYQLCGKSYFCSGGNPVLTLNPIFIQANIFTRIEEKTKGPLFWFLETLIWGSIEWNSGSEVSSNARKKYLNTVACKNKESVWEMYL